MKTLEEYLQLPYAIQLTQDEDGSWFVSIPELPGCMSVGTTPDEAITMIRDAQRVWIETALEQGMPVPEPRAEEEYSGNFRLRVPRSLHRKLVETAEKEGVSLNTVCAGALAEAVGTAGKAPQAAIPETPRQAAIRELMENEDCFSAGKDLDACLADWLRREVSNALQDMREGEALRGNNSLVSVARDLKRLRKLDPLLGMMAELLDLLRADRAELILSSAASMSISTMVDRYAAGAQTVAWKMGAEPSTPQEIGNSSPQQTMLEGIPEKKRRE